MRRSSSVSSGCARLTSGAAAVLVWLIRSSPIIMNDVPTDHRLLESIPDAVVVTAPDGEIVFVNFAAERLTGYKRKELVGKKVEVLVPTRLRGVHVRSRRGFYVKGIARLMGEADRDLMLRRKDGGEVSVEISLGPAGEDTVAVV